MDFSERNQVADKVTEEVRTGYKNGKQIRYWFKPQGARNEALTGEPMRSPGSTRATCRGRSWCATRPLRHPWTRRLKINRRSKGPPAGAPDRASATD